MLFVDITNRCEHSLVLEDNDSRIFFEAAQRLFGAGDAEYTAYFSLKNAGAIRKGNALLLLAAGERVNFQLRLSKLSFYESTPSSDLFAMPKPRPLFGTMIIRLRMRPFPALRGADFTSNRMAISR
jgi:hypothetical protein